MVVVGVPLGLFMIWLSSLAMAARHEFSHIKAVLAVLTPWLLAILAGLFIVVLSLAARGA